MKEQVTKFNLEAAFKALDEIEIPQVGGIKPNKDNHKELVESMRPTPKTDCLLEDYYDVNNNEDLEAAQTNRAEEVAQAKLAKIEKIVDLDAESPEDLQPSYVGKTIVQCPQCMTLFYRNQEDLNPSEDDEHIVNVGEVCPNCGNDSGYQLVGKVAEVEPEEAQEFNAEVPAEENELNLDFEEPKEEEIPEENSEEESEEEINLEPVEEPTEENKEEEKSEEEEEEKKEEAFEAHSGNILAEQVENALNEETNVDELTKKLKEHDEYIKVLQDEIKAEEEAVKNAKNNFIKKMHEKNLEALKDALDKAIPEEVKAEAAIEELPTAEDAAEDMTKNEALNEAKAVDLVNELKKHKDYENFSDAVLRKILKLYKEDVGTRIKDATAQDIIDWVGDFDEFIIAFADDLDMKLAKELAMACPKIIDACKKTYKKDIADEDEDFTDKEAVNAIFEYSQDKDAKNTMTVSKALDAIKNNLKESLCEEEKFPNPDKHELVDTVDGVEIYHCKNCGKYGAKINDKVVKKDSIEEIKDCIAGKCDEAVCPKCGKDVEDPCETDREAYHCENNLDDDVKESLEEDIIAKEAPEKADDIELKQRKVSEIHKGKEEHVPGSIVEESLTEATDVKAELDAFMANLGEGCEHCEESVENEIKMAEVEQEVNNEPLNEDGEKCDIALMKEINEPMSFKELINNPTFKQFGESIEESKLEEELPAAIVAAGAEAANNLEKLKDEDNAYIDQLEKEQEARKFAEENAEFEAEELNDSFINETISNYLTEVYSNVKDFTATECSMTDNKLVIEGIINFKSGKNKTTKFEFTQVTPVLYEGINKDLAENGKFTLNCFREGNGKILMAESLAYSYTIGKNLIEGLTKKAGR